MISSDRLRPMVESVDRDLSRLVLRQGADSPETAALLTSWAQLVEVLALGPAPELRACPHCGSIGMRAATRCGVCWNRLVPPTSSRASTDQLG